MSVPYKALVSRISGAAARDRQQAGVPHAMDEVSGTYAGRSSGRSTIQRLVDLKMYLAEHTEPPWETLNGRLEWRWETVTSDSAQCT
jgi:hypothetical protein